LYEGFPTCIPALFHYSQDEPVEEVENRYYEVKHQDCCQSIVEVPVVFSYATHGLVLLDQAVNMEQSQVVRKEIVEQ
jgi:hypothetical protein